MSEIKSGGLDLMAKCNQLTPLPFKGLNIESSCVFVVDLGGPEVRKHLDGCCDVVLRLQRPTCSDGSYGFVVAYSVSYCTASSETGEFVENCRTTINEEYYCLHRLVHADQCFFHQ